MTLRHRAARPCNLRMQVSALQWRSLSPQRRETWLDDILVRLRQRDPACLQRYALQAREVVAESLQAGPDLGVTDEALLLDWCHARVASGVPFHRDPRFADVLRHPLLHPDAKARHMAMAFFAAQRLQAQANAPWPQ